MMESVLFLYNVALLGPKSCRLAVRFTYKEGKCNTSSTSTSLLLLLRQLVPTRSELT